MRNNGNTDPGLPRDNGFAAIDQALQEKQAGFRQAGESADPALSVPEILALQLTASQGILRLLEDRGVAKPRYSRRNSQKRLSRIQAVI